MSPEFWLQLTSAAINIAVLIAIVKLTRMFAHIEFKVNMMWRVFETKFERRGDDFVSRPRYNQKDLD